MKKSIKILLISLSSLIIVLGLILGISFAVLAGKTNSMNDDFSFLYTEEKYTKVVSVDGVQVITQEISCGYAVIEMFSAWNGGNVTEQNLFDKYGKVTTSTGKSFCKEFNKQFPEYQTKIYKYLKNSELIDKVYNNLAEGIPVPFEWVAKYEDEWTLHYSLVIRLDIPNDTITVANPYGYLENLTIKDFLDRT
ncbi:MAG: hypothetical protein K2N42_03275, partial [Anaeroplasmataceae bacterium]|nr:hypothetical protein [Anaeroplasmataceae bacterium]